MIDLVLKKSKERSLLRRHPWVYDTAVQKGVRAMFAMQRSWPMP